MFYFIISVMYNKYKQTYTVSIIYSLTGDEFYTIANINNASMITESAVVSQFVRDQKYFTWCENGDLFAFDVAANGDIFKSFNLKPGNLAALSSTGDLLATSNANNVEIWLISGNTQQVKSFFL